MVLSLWSSGMFKKRDDECIIRDALRRNVLFESLTQRQLSIVNKIVHIRKYGVGEYVFNQHQPGAGMYIIVKGKIGIQTEKLVIDEETEKEKKDTVLLTTLEENDFFGELALVDDKSLRSASAKVLEPATLIGFFKPDLLEIMDTQPVIGMKIAFKIAQILGQRLVETNEELARQGFVK
ncbi:MAG: cyclic nucleotide-binding domain-containing protein [Oligoflexia bacterium]|nr:cyclic nucleotide-binding domain-containing protein [Oligoflexia bacterium]